MGCRGAVGPYRGYRRGAGPPRGFTPQTLEPEEIATLRKRGEDFFAQGDVTAARLMLQPAAQAADARAAFALAATYARSCSGIAASRA
jgi:hypothetical protein